MAARKIAEMRLEKAKVARLLAQSQSSVGEMKGVDADEFATHFSQLTRDEHWSPSLVVWLRHVHGSTTCM